MPDEMFPPARGMEWGTQESPVPPRERGEGMLGTGFLAETVQLV